MAKHQSGELRCPATALITDPKLAKLVDKINKLLRNRKSINEVQFSWCVIMNVGTQFGTKSVKI